MNQNNFGLFSCSDVGKHGNTHMAKVLGMGTILHRIETCLAVALGTGSSCLIDDSHFPYDRRNLGKYYEDLKICSSGEQRKEPELFISVRSPEYVRYILNVPTEVKRSLENCHEDTAGWYRGVILKHMLHLSYHSEQSIAKLLRDSRLMDSHVDIPQITSVHIRSTEKRRLEKVLPARQAIIYFLAEYFCTKI